MIIYSKKPLKGDDPDSDIFFLIVMRDLYEELKKNREKEEK